MRVSCPACAAAYEVPDRLIGAAGRKLRCARCGTEWVATAPAPAPPPAAPPQPGPLARALAEGAAGLPAGVAPPAAAPAPPRRVTVSPAAPRPSAEGDPFAGVLAAVSGQGEAAGATPEPPPPAPPQVAAAAAAAPPAAGRGALGLAWALTALVVVLLVVGVFALREPIVAAWPPAARLYMALGLAPAGG